MFLRLNGCKSPSRCSFSTGCRHPLTPTAAPTATPVGEYPVFESPAVDASQHLLMQRDFSQNRSRVLTAACASSCAQQDCHQSDFTIQAWFHVRSVVMPEILISVSPSNQAMRQAETVAVNDLQTFVIDALACVSFWTGLTPVGVVLAKRVMRRLRKAKVGLMLLYKILVIIAVTSAYVWQVYKISCRYFSFATSNRITFTPIGYLMPRPSVDFCHAFPSNRSLDTFQGKPIGSVTGTDDNHYINDIGNYSIHSYRVDGLVCHSIVKRKSLQTSSDVPKAANSCTTNASVRPQAIQMTDLMAFTVDPCYQKQVMGSESALITLHSSIVSAFDASSNVIQVQAREPLTVFLSFSVIMLHRLPVPYDTGCRQQSFARSNRDCFEDCYTSATLRSFNAYPIDSERNVSVTRTIDLMSLHVDQRSRLANMKHHCRTFCGKQCIKPHNFLRLSMQRKERGIWTFTIERSRAIVTLITSSPMTTSFDLMTAVLNGASFWLAFCPASLLLSRRVMRWYRRRQQPHQ